MKVPTYGTGFAGEGHTEAFRGAGTDVVGMVGLTPSVVSAMVSKKHIRLNTRK